MKNIIDKTIEKASKEHSAKIEEYVRLRIQPKPKWLPSSIWKKMLKRLLVLDRFSNLASYQKAKKYADDLAKKL